MLFVSSGSSSNILLALLLSFSSDTRIRKIFKNLSQLDFVGFSIRLSKSLSTEDFVILSVSISSWCGIFGAFLFEAYFSFFIY